MNKNKLQTLKDRLNKIGIHIVLNSNWPFCYLTSINSHTVKEKRMSEHGWVIAYGTIRDGVTLTGVDETFDLIREYVEKRDEPPTMVRG